VFESIDHNTNSQCSGECRVIEKVYYSASRAWCKT
jgi:hypothetical protein